MIGKNKVMLQVSIDKKRMELLQYLSKTSKQTKSYWIEVAIDTLMRILQELDGKEGKKDEVN